VCAAEYDVAEPLRWQCANVGDGGHHVLGLVGDRTPWSPAAGDEPFVAFDRSLAWAAFADAHGVSADRRAALVAALDARLREVGDVGFHRTPLRRADSLSAHLGFSDDGGVWVKDDTGNVSGSHKARHLATILLHLQTVELVRLQPWSTDARPPLAIASCGNAAVAAATLAAAARWPVHVFVPPDADTTVLARLRALHAVVHESPRRADDPPGDPCILRFREAVAAGAIPFSVQGPENAWCLDGGRTIGWEIADTWRTEAGARPPDRVFVPTGGGAFVSCLGAGLAEADMRVAVHAVQTEGCAPLAAAWHAALALGDGGLAAAPQRWAEWMRPWPTTPHSLADGILDDETYDWLGALDAMSHGGHPVVAAEADVVAAYRLAHASTDIDVSPTGCAGLAGLLAVGGEVSPHERVVVPFSGVRRGTPLPTGVA
jgi:threonine dehydratase